MLANGMGLPITIADSVPTSHHDLLEAAGTAVLVTIDSKGRPQATAVWYLLDEDGVLKTSVEAGRQKYKNAAANPAVDFFFIDPTNPFHTLEIRAAAVLTPDTDYALLGRLVARYGVPIENILQSGTDRHVITFHPWRVIANG